MKKILRKAWKVLWIFLLSLIALIFLIFIALKLPVTQRFIADKAENFLQQKIKTEVSIGNLDMNFPKSISLEDVYLEGQNRDTLLFAGHIGVNIGLSGLLNKEINVNQVNLFDIQANVIRKDSTFNFNYIIEAFADTTSQKPDTAKSSGGGWTFSIDNLELADIEAKYYDLDAGDSIRTHLGHFDTSFDSFDTDKQKFILGEINLSDTKFWMVKNSTSTTSSPDTSSSALPQFDFDEINLSNITAEYTDRTQPQRFYAQVSSLVVGSDEIDLQNKKIALDEITLENSQFLAELYQPKDTTTQQTQKPDSATSSSPFAIPWQLSLDELDFYNIDFKYHNMAEPDTVQGFDPNHLSINNLEVQIEDLYLQDQELGLEIMDLAFAEDDYFRLKEFQANIEINDERLRVKDLLVSTGKSQIKTTTRLVYPNLNDFIDDISKGSYDTQFSDSWIGVDDLKYFVPTLSDSLFAGPEKEIHFAIDAEGSTAQTTLNQLLISFGTESYIRLEGVASNLLDIDNLTMDLGLENYLKRSDIESLLSKKMIPSGISLPDYISGYVDLQGAMNDFFSEVDQETNYGNLSSQLEFLNLFSDEIPQYDLSLSAENIDLQKILESDSTGPGFCSFDLELQGEGFDPEKMDNEYSLALHHLDFNRYDYRELDLEGGVKNGILSSQGGIVDSNIVVSIDNSLDLNNFFNFELYLNVEAADLQRLNFSTSDIRLQGMVEADFSGTGWGSLEGQMAIRDLLVIKDGDRYPVDSLVVATVMDSTKNDIVVNSNFLSGWLKGNVTPPEMAVAMKRQVNNYIKIFEDVPDSIPEDQHFSFDFSINQTELITEVILPQLESFQAGSIKGSFNEPKDNVDINISIPQIIYSDLRIDTLQFTMKGDRDSLKTVLSFEKLSVDTINMHYTALGVEIGERRAHTFLHSFDKSGTKEYDIRALLEQPDENLTLQLEDSVLLHYTQWNVHSDNSIVFKDEIHFNNFRLTNEGKSLALKNIEDTPGFLILAENFPVGSLTALLSEKMVPVSGSLSGTVKIGKDLPLSADLDLRNIEIFEKPLGNIHFTASEIEKALYNLRMELSGNRNSVIAEGTYSMQDSISTIDIQTDINQIGLTSFNPFTKGFLSDMSGKLSGKVNATGPVTGPGLTGHLQFTDVSLIVDYLSARFKLKDERINLTEEGLRFPSFTMRDSTGNKAVINGKILTDNFQDFEFDLTINTNDYKILSTTQETSEIYYGTIILDSEISVDGTMQELDVNADITLEEGTIFNMLIPSSNVAAQERTGIVEFIDPDAGLEEKILTRNKLNEASQTDFTNLKFTSNITIDDQTRLNIIIDPTTGDRLSLRGGAVLSLNINPGGDIDLVGNYKIEEGMYQMKAFGVMRREFEIKSGSSIEWTGDPLGANVDITAIYRTRTSPYNLVAPYMSGGTEAQMEQLRSKVPFLVLLMMEGALLQPAISFNIELPEGQKNVMGGRVYARLNQLRENESALNKQVFALLVLNSFIAENPLAGSNDGSSPAASTARKSVSRFLSDQLNRLSDKYIEGVDIEVDVESYSDYSQSGPAGQTDVNLNVSKNLMNDRLIVKVGSSIAVEGQEAQNQNFNDITGDLVIEYKITEDGRYRFKVFRVNSYENLAVGQVTETGGGIIFTRDFNHIEELFRKPEDTEEKENSGGE